MLPLNIIISITFEHTTGWLEVVLRHHCSSWAGIIYMPPWTILSLWIHYSAPDAKHLHFLLQKMNIFKSLNEMIMLFYNAGATWADMVIIWLPRGYHVANTLFCHVPNTCYLQVLFKYGSIFKLYKHSISNLLVLSIHLLGVYRQSVSHLMKGSVVHKQFTKWEKTIDCDKH